MPSSKRPGRRNAAFAAIFCFFSILSIVAYTALAEISHKTQTGVGVPSVDSPWLLGGSTTGDLVGDTITGQSLRLGVNPAVQWDYWTVADGGTASVATLVFQVGQLTADGSTVYWTDVDTVSANSATYVSEIRTFAGPLYGDYCRLKITACTNCQIRARVHAGNVR